MREPYNKQPGLADDLAFRQPVQLLASKTMRAHYLAVQARTPRLTKSTEAELPLVSS